MNRAIPFLLLVAVLLLGACTGAEPVADVPAGDGPATASEVVVYLSPT